MYDITLSDSDSYIFILYIKRLTWPKDDKLTLLVQYTKNQKTSICQSDSCIDPTTNATTPNHITSFHS